MKHMIHASFENRLVNLAIEITNAKDQKEGLTQIPTCQPRHKCLAKT